MYLSISIMTVSITLWYNCVTGVSRNTILYDGHTSFFLFLALLLPLCSRFGCLIKPLFSLLRARNAQTCSQFLVNLLSIRIDVNWFREAAWECFAKEIGIVNRVHVDKITCNWLMNDDLPCTVDC